MLIIVLYLIDNNELEIVKHHGLEPIVNGTMVAAEGLELSDGRSDKEIGLLEELGTQCARALRNLSVNRTSICLTCVVHSRRQFYTVSSLSSTYYVQRQTRQRSQVWGLSDIC